MNIDNIDLNKFIEKYIEFVDMISIKGKFLQMCSIDIIMNFEKKICFLKT